MIIMRYFPSFLKEKITWVAPVYKSQKAPLSSLKNGLKDKNILVFVRELVGRNEILPLKNAL